MGNLPYKWPLTLVPKNTHLYTGVKLGFFKWYAQNSTSTQSGLPNCFHVGDLIKFLCSWCLTFDKVIISLGLTVTSFHHFSFDSYLPSVHLFCFFPVFFFLLLFLFIFDILRVSCEYGHGLIHIKVAEHSFAGGQRQLAWRRVF